MKQEYRLCRCGHSAHKPFCDSTHLKIRFDGTETASRAPYLEQAEVFEGPAMDLTDAQPLCASGRFCDPDGSIWNLIGQTDSPEGREKVKHQSGHCPSGRLIVWDKATRQPYEPALEPSLGLVQDPVAGVSGPIWVRAGLPSSQRTAKPTRSATELLSVVAAPPATSRFAMGRTEQSGSRMACDSRQ